jgi:glycosyltransferase involved in cell wall biosynthesis
MLEHITPLILTYNEAPNIARTVSQLGWARQILVMDSFSSDATLEILRGFANVRVLQRKFDSFDAQWNYALSHGGIDSEWVLALDADYVLTAALVRELTALQPTTDVSGYRVRFRYCMDGVALRGTLYPPSTVLFRRSVGRYAQDGHAYRLQLASGRVVMLHEHMLHDDRKPFSRWLSSQQRYAVEEAQKLTARSWSELGWPDRVRSVPFLAAPLVGVHCLVGKGCLLDGRPGLKYAGQRTLAELIISLKLLQRR